MRISPANLGQAIIGDTSVLGRHGGRADRFQWRIGERKDLPQAAKAFHEPQTGVDIDQRIEPRERGYRNVLSLIHISEPTRRS